MNSKFLLVSASSAAIIMFIILLYSQFLVQSPRQDLRDSSQSMPTLLMYPGLIVAMASGLFGATFSMLVRANERSSAPSLEDVQAAKSWHTLLVRCSFGVGAAVILYFFFESGLVEGSLWPKLARLRFNPIMGDNEQPLAVYRVVPNKDWSTLIIWSFIAGFSEHLVPSILIKTEGNSQSPPQQG